MSAWDRFLRGFGVLVGRLALVFIFLSAGYHHGTDLPGMLGGMGKQLPVPAGLLTPLAWGAVACLLLGGVLVTLGLWTRLGAFLLILFIVPTTVFFHDFWAAGGEEHARQLTQFNKNLGLFGGLMLLLAFGAGSVSLDALRARKVRGRRAA